MIQLFDQIIIQPATLLVSLPDGLKKVGLKMVCIWSLIQQIKNQMNLYKQLKPYPSN